MTWRFKASKASKSTGKAKRVTPVGKEPLTGLPKPQKAISMDKLDREFSKFIRERDSAEFGGVSFRCISCGQVKPFEQADAGHYLGRQYFATRWDEINVQAQCRFDNRFNEGLKSKFREGLVRKYGEEAILKLEAMHKTGRKPRQFEAELILSGIREKRAKLGR